MDALAGIAGVDPAQFTGAGNLRDHSSHIEVDKEISEKVKDSINGKNYPENLRSEKLEADAVMVCDFADPNVADHPITVEARGIGDDLNQRSRTNTI